MSRPRTYTFKPNGWDLIFGIEGQPAPGTVVKKVQPFGCPKNGTMGHCYVVPADGTGNQYGVLVCLDSLEPVRPS